ncbi:MULTISPECIES: hypothetical protein [unclassified Janibacter]|uniref:hypothetical protein n=1 Tax=unclassified Janibacter TaxID=2649294 RepID=UPI003CFD3037
MARSNRRRPESRPLSVDRALGGLTQRATFRGRAFNVRRLTGASSERTYRCPGCQHEIVPGTPHVVVWPAEGITGIEERRHWHNPCWDRRDGVHTPGSVL